MPFQLLIGKGLIFFWRGRGFWGGFFFLGGGGGGGGQLGRNMWAVVVVERWLLSAGFNTRKFVYSWPGGKDEAVL